MSRYAKKAQASKLSVRKNILDYTKELNQLIPLINEHFSEFGLVRIIIQYYKPQVLVRKHRFKLIPKCEWINNTLSWKFSLRLLPLESNEYCQRKITFLPKKQPNFIISFARLCSQIPTCYLRYNRMFSAIANILCKENEFEELAENLEFYLLIRQTINSFRYGNYQGKNIATFCVICDNKMSPEMKDRVLNSCKDCYEKHRLMYANPARVLETIKRKCGHDDYEYIATCNNKYDCQLLIQHHDVLVCRECAEERDYGCCCPCENCTEYLPIADIEELGYF
jgi:hypothetical protein